MSKEYNSDSIRVLSDTEHIRQRYGMYIGSADHPGQLFSEVFDNALDEVQSGYSDRVLVEVDTSRNTYTVRDYGRGIPHGMKKMEDGTEKEVVEVLCTKSFSGGKFSNENYKMSSGLNGVGMCCCSALSDTMTVSSYRGGKVVRCITEQGKCISVEYDDTSEPNGTEVQLVPDTTIFESASIPLDFIINRCKVASSFSMPVSLVVDHECVNVDSSIFDLIVEDEDVVKYCDYEGEVRDTTTGEYVKFAISYNSSTSYRSKGYTNLLPNPQGGTHIRMIDEALAKAWDRIGVKDILSKDYYLGVREVVAVFISETSFSSQTKERLTVPKSSLERFIDPIADKIYEYLMSNPEVRDALIRRMQDYRASQNRLLSKKELKSWLILNNDTSGTVRRKSVVSKLVECTNKSRDDTELCICEGDSAMGSIVSSRDTRTQAVLPIRGKILNVAKLSDIRSCLSNAEVRDIVNSLGAGLLDQMDLSKLRYSRVIIMTDADEDGKNIAALVTALFVNVLPDFVKDGRLYAAMPPLYGWKDKSGVTKFANKIEDVPDSIQPTRFKGLGEMNPDQIHDTLLDTSARDLIQIEYPEDLNRFNEILTSSSAKYEMLENLGVVKYRPYRSE